MTLRPLSSRKSSRDQRIGELRSSYSPHDLENEEERLKTEASQFSLYRVYRNGLASFGVFFLYLALWDTLLVSLFTTALTVYHYYYVRSYYVIVHLGNSLLHLQFFFKFPQGNNMSSKLDFVFLSFGTCSKIIDFYNKLAS